METETKKKSSFPLSRSNRVHFEVYLKSEEGELGYEIETGWMNRSDLDRTKKEIKWHYGKRFDCFIDCHNANMNPSDKFVFWAT